MFELLDQNCCVTVVFGFDGLSKVGTHMTLPNEDRTMSADSRNPEGETIVVTKSNNWFVAKDEESGIASQGQTKADALSNLAEALALADQPVSEEDDVQEESSAPWL